MESCKECVFGLCRQDNPEIIEQYNRMVRDNETLWKKVPFAPVCLCKEGPEQDEINGEKAHQNEPTVSKTLDSSTGTIVFVD